MAVMASPQYDIQVRGPTDATFRWSPTAPLEIKVAVSGDVADFLEVTDIYEYEIGITPDLGWDDRADMFQPYHPSDPDNTNTRLFIKTGLSVDNGNLTFDAANEQLYVVLTDDEMDSFMSDGYPDYVWSVRGVTRYGIKSAWAPRRKFRGRYQAQDNSFTVNPIPEYAPTRTMTLHGTKSDYIRAIEVNGTTGQIKYPSQGTWEYDVVLNAGTNVFNVRGHPDYGRATAWKKVETTLYTGEVGLQHIPNSFDQYGALVGLDRLTSLDETNDNYATRLKDVFIHPAESNLQGLHYSIARNLNIEYDDYALVIRPALIEDWRRSDDLYTNLKIEIGTNKLYVSSSDFLVDHEYHTVAPQDLSITLDHEITLVPETIESVKVYSPPSQPIPTTDYTVDIEEKKVTLAEGYQYKDVWVTYARKLETDIGPSVTLSGLTSALTGLSYNGHQILDVTMSSDRSGGENSDGILRGEFFIQSSNRFKHRVDGITVGYPVRWTNMSIHHLLDEDLWDRYLNADGHLLNTKIESYVDRFKKKSHLTWEQVILDQDVWDPIDELTEKASNLYFSSDLKFGYWTSSSAMSTSRYTTTEAFDRGFISEEDKSLLVYVGVPAEKIKPGIGRDKDLKLVIPKPTKTEVLTEPDVFRATVSWSITGQVNDATYLPNSPYGSLLFGLS